MKLIDYNTTNYNKNSTAMSTFEFVDGDRIAFNHIPLEIQELFFSVRANDYLSFVIYNYNTLEDYSFVLLKESNYNGRKKGVEILALGYSNEESYKDLINQLRYHVFNITQDNEFSYDYIWAKNVDLSEHNVVVKDNMISIIKRV